MKNALILDDSEKVRSTLHDILNEIGFKVFEADNGSDGLIILEENKIDLLILDLVMPHKSGIDTLIELKNFKDYKDLKIIYA